VVIVAGFESVLRTDSSTKKFVIPSKLALIVASRAGSGQPPTLAAGRAVLSPDAEMLALFAVESAGCADSIARTSLWRRALDPKTLGLLVCPATKTPLKYSEQTQELISQAAGLAFPIWDGIPIMLVDQARVLSPDELTALRC